MITDAEIRSPVLLVKLHFWICCIFWITELFNEKIVCFPGCPKRLEEDIVEPTGSADKSKLYRCFINNYGQYQLIIQATFLQLAVDGVTKTQENKQRVQVGYLIGWCPGCLAFETIMQETNTQSIIKSYPRVHLEFYQQGSSTSRSRRNSGWEKYFFLEGSGAKRTKYFLKLLIIQEFRFFVILFQNYY